jgi:hypothetical protein
MSSSEEEDLGIMPDDLSQARSKKKRNIHEIEPVSGEGNLKGFVSAFQTIMDRSDKVGGSELLASAAVSQSESKPVKSSTSSVDSKVISSHDPNPSWTCERELAFKASAERGVVKLFRAVAMSRKRAIEIEASKGIGLTKSGQRRRLRRPLAASVPTATSSSSGSMASFLDALKKQKKSIAH